jgi:hypothetical protein
VHVVKTGQKADEKILAKMARLMLLEVRLGARAWQQKDKRGSGVI